MSDDRSEIKIVAELDAAQVARTIEAGNRAAAQSVASGAAGGRGRKGSRAEQAEAPVPLISRYAPRARTAAGRTIDAEENWELPWEGEGGLGAPAAVTPRGAPPIVDPEKEAALLKAQHKYWNPTLWKMVWTEDAGKPPEPQEPVAPRINRGEQGYHTANPMADNAQGRGEKQGDAPKIEGEKEQAWLRAASVYHARSYAPASAASDGEGEDESGPSYVPHRPGARWRLNAFGATAFRAGLAPIAVGMHFGLAAALSPFRIAAAARQAGGFGNLSVADASSAAFGDVRRNLGTQADLIGQGASQTVSRQRVKTSDDDEGDGEDDANPEERRHREMMSAMKKYGGQGANLTRNVAMGAVGYGIGSSIMGFFSEASQQYIQHAATLRQLKQTYREFGAEATSVGRSIGYVTEETSKLVGAIGTQTNSVTSTRFMQYAGFARQYGLEDTEVAGTVGKISRLSGGHFFQASEGQLSSAQRQLGMTRAQAQRQSSSISLLGIHAAAEASGMGQGRFGEYMQTLSSAAEAQFHATGEVNSGAMFATKFGGMVFGQDSERGRGESGLSFAQGAGRMMSGDSSQAMRVYMMRALNYGKAGGPGMIEMDKQLEAGITDPKNAAAFFGRIRQTTSGMSAENRKFTAYMMLKDDAKKSGLNASGLEALVDAGFDDAKFAQMQEFAEDPDKAMEANFSAEGLNKGAFKAGGFGEVGRRKTTLAEARKVQLESMKEGVGAEVTGIMVTLGNTMKNLGGAFSDLFKGISGQRPLQALQGLATSAERASETLEMLSATSAGQYATKGVTGVLGEFWDEFGVRRMWNAQHPTTGTIRTRKNPAKHPPTAGAGGGNR